MDCEEDSAEVPGEPLPAAALGSLPLPSCLSSASCSECPAAGKGFVSSHSSERQASLCPERESLKLEGCARCPGTAPAWVRAVPLPDPIKERCEDTFIKGLPQKYFVVFAVLYKCEALSFCSGVLPVRGF